MKSHKVIRLSAFAFVLLAITGTMLHAQSEFSHGWSSKTCRAESSDVLAGSWRAKLSITNLSTTDTLMSLSQGGGLIETDALDLVDPNVAHSPGYGQVKAADCNHYDVTIMKFLYSYSTKEPQTTVLHGSVILSKDGNSFSGELHQQFFNSTGQVVFTDTVSVTAERIKASAAE